MLVPYSGACKDALKLCAEAVCSQMTDFFKMLKKAFNFELSLGVLSTAAVGLDSVGVDLPDRSAEGALEEPLEDGASAMMAMD